MLNSELLLCSEEDDEEVCGTLEAVDELRILVDEADELEEGPGLLLLLEDEDEANVSAALILDVAELDLLLGIIADEVVEDALVD